MAIEIGTFEKLAYKTLSQCDGNADADADADTDADDRGDCNSSPCTSYRRAINHSLDILQSYLLKMASKMAARLLYVWHYVSFVQFNGCLSR